MSEVCGDARRRAGLARVASGQNADDYRGGWRTDSGEAHTYQFSIRGTTVRASTVPTARRDHAGVRRRNIRPDGSLRSHARECGRQHVYKDRRSRRSKIAVV